MAAILTTCPCTQTRVPTGHHATRAQFAAAEISGGRFRCPACNQIHEWDRVDAWLATGAATSQAS